MQPPDFPFEHERTGGPGNPYPEGSHGAAIERVLEVAGNAREGNAGTSAWVTLVLAQACTQTAAGLGRAVSASPATTATSRKPTLSPGP